MADLARTVQIIFNAVDNTETGVGNVTNQLTNAQAAADALSDALAGLVAGFSVSEFIDANVAFEAFERTMVLLKGSSEAAADEFEYIRNLANLLGLELFSTANAYSNLSAATKGTALEGDQTRFIFEAVTSSMSALGKSAYDTEGALLAISQMVSKGNVSMEELRQQLGERLPGAFQVAASSMNLTTSELVDLVSTGKLATTEFLPAFAAELEKVYGGVQQVDTFSAAWNRLLNTFKEISIDLGQSGVMDAATKGVEGLAFAIVATTSAATLMGSAVRAVLDFLATGDISQYMKDNEAATAAFGESTKRSYNALFDVNEQLQGTGAAAVIAGDKMQDGFGRGEDSAKKMKEQAKLADELLRKMGLDPKQFVEPIEAGIEQMQGVISDMVNNPEINGAEMLSGLLVAIDKLSTDEFPALEAAARGAFDDGKLSAEQYDAALYSLATKQEGLWDAMVVTTDATNKQAEAQKKAQEETRKSVDEANKYQLKLIEIASNEKIKVIEARFQLDIAEVEANAQIATAIINSIGETYAADVGLIGDLMSQVTDGYSFADRTRIAMAKESSERVEELHGAQMRLIAAQVDYMRAKTAAASSGNPLVSIQADGLKPHLEAFMWEILAAIQVKMAYDGADMLVGGCSI
jgi:tape measure domain-containing protein